MSKSYTPEYAAWKRMRQRCTNPANKRYSDWGGRGIKVCDRWQSFENFLTDMGPRPPGTSLDRWPDNDGNYEPGNCRWATPAEQVKNRRNTIVVTLDGLPACLKDWCTSLNVNYQTAYMRIQRGMTPLEALILPVQERRQ